MPGKTGEALEGHLSGFMSEENDRIINQPTSWFAMVPAWAFEQAVELGASGIATFAVLCLHASKAKRCFPSIPTIAKESGQGETATKEALRKLKDLGLIRVISQGTGRGHANLYEIVDRLEIKGSPDDGLDAKGVAKGSPRDSERGRHATTNRPIEHINKDSKIEDEVNRLRNIQALDKLRGELSPIFA